MDARQAVKTLEVIRTLMERTTQYEVLTAWTGLVAGTLALTGAALLAFVFDAGNPWHFGGIWGMVFLGSLLTTIIGTAARCRERGEKVWTRQARTVLAALAPGLAAALVLSVLFFARGEHAWLPGVWMLCYGQGALATASYAPAPIPWLGWAAILLGAVTLAIGPEWAVLMMGLVFGVGHIGLGSALLVADHRRGLPRLYSEVA